MPPAIFADADLDQQLFGRAEPIRGVETFGKRRKLANRLDIGRKPGKPVGRALFTVEQAIHDMIVGRHPLADGRHRFSEQRFGCAHSRPRQCDELYSRVAPLGPVQALLLFAARGLHVQYDHCEKF